MKVWHEVWQKVGVVAFRKDAVVALQWLEPFKAEAGWVGVVLVYLQGGHAFELKTLPYQTKEEAQKVAHQMYSEIKKEVSKNVR